MNRRRAQSRDRQRRDAARPVPPVMSPPEALALVALTFAACALHAAVGFGSGPLLMPLLLTLTTPARAVVAAVGVGMVVNVLQLVTERRRPRPPLRTLWPLLAWSSPPAAAARLLRHGRRDRPPPRRHAHA